MRLCVSNTFQNVRKSVLKSTSHLDVHLFVFLFHHETVMRFQNLPQRSEELILHYLLSAPNILQPHVARTKSNRNLRPTQPFIGGKSPHKYLGFSGYQHLEKGSTWTAWRASCACCRFSRRSAARGAPSSTLESIAAPHLQIEKKIREPCTCEHHVQIVEHLLGSAAHCEMSRFRVHDKMLLIRINQHGHRGFPESMARLHASARGGLCKLSYLVIHDSGEVCLEYLLLAWYPSQRKFVEPTNLEPIKPRTSYRCRARWEQLEYVLKIVL